MSHRALQRTLVRLLHDPTLVERFAETGRHALEEPELSAQELDWLSAANPAAFLTDPYRQGRVLTSLVEELPTSSLLAAARVPGGLVSFFTTPWFHESIRRDRALRLGFADFLTAAGDDVAALVSVERLLMEMRRSSEATSTAELAVAPRVTWAPCPGGTLDLYQSLWAELSRTGKPLVEAVLSLAGSQRQAQGLGVAEAEILLVEPDGRGGFHIGEIPPGLEAILNASKAHGTLRACQAAALNAGASESEALEIIQELIGDGLLVQRDA